MFQFKLKVCRVFYFLIAFLLLEVKAYPEYFSSRVKNKNFLLVYKDGNVLARYDTIVNAAPSSPFAANNNSFNSELSKLQTQANQSNINPQSIGEKIPLSNAYFKYEYKPIEDGIYELENGAVIKILNSEAEIVKKKDFASFDEFFHEKYKACHELKFNFIYQNFILKKEFFGYYYQIYIPYYFDTVLLILLFDKRKNKIKHLITSSNNDFSCIYNKIFYNFNSVKNFNKNNKDKLDEINTTLKQEKNRKQKQENSADKEEIPDKILEEKINLERNFKIAFQSLLSAKEVIREKTEDIKDTLDNVNTFDFKTLNFYTKNKKLKKSIINKELFEINEFTEVELLDNAILNKFSYLIIN